MKINRLPNELRMALRWLALASGDPSALDLVQRECRPSLADQMTEILETISENERRWQSRLASTPTEL